MKTLLILTKRNSKLFFKDKGMFFSSLITPAILLVLYVTFLSNVYRDSFLSALPDGFTLSESIIGGVVGGQLASSLLAVCCVTIAFCSNLLMIQDKVTGSVRDLTVTPVKRSVLAMGYFASSALVTLIVCLVTWRHMLCIPCRDRRMVFKRRRHCAYTSGCFSAYAVRHCTFILPALFSHDSGAAFGRRNACKRRLRLCMRRIYAHVKLPRRASEGAFVPPRHLRHEPAAQSLDARRARRNGQQRRTLAGH